MAWRFCFATIVREHDFVGEQRGPLIGRHPVGIGAADQFMFAGGKFEQFGLAEPTDKAFAIALRE